MAELVVHIDITGRVQGVGFRDWVAGEARAHGLSGWVRNRRDGSVEAVFAGDQAAVETVIRACHEGPPMAAVEDVVVKEPLENPGAGFHVLPTA